MIRIIEVHRLGESDLTKCLLTDRKGLHPDTPNPTLSVLYNIILHRLYAGLGDAAGG